MVGKGVPPKRENHLSLPTRVVGGRLVQHNGHEGPHVVNPSGLRVEGSDGVGVKPGGVGSLGSDRGILMGDRRATEEEALCNGHLGGQGGTHARSCAKARDATCSRSWEAASMVAMAATSAEDAGRGLDGDATVSAHAGAARVGWWSGNPDGEDQVRCCGCWCAGKALGSPTEREWRYVAAAAGTP